MSSIMPSCKTKKHYDRIVVNVGGVRHETFLSTLKNIPDTRLYNLGEHHTTLAKSTEYDSSRGEYFFDRHPGVFAHILNYYRTGRLHCPADVCGPLFEEELGFWGIDEQQVETCCWENYKQHKEKQEKLKYFKLPGFEEDLEDKCLSQDSGLFEDVDDAQSWWSRYQPRVWKSLEEPHTSLWAKFVGMISFLMFTAYLIKFSLTTLDYFSDRTAPRYIALSVTHLMCMSWFTMDFALRLVFSPEKSAFAKSPYTWTDLIPLVLLYVFFFYPSLESIPFLEMLVMLKAARIFQLFKLSYVLQVLVNTLKASSCELCLLLGIMAFVMVVFASVLYFLERHEFESDFRNIPESMWWAVITMTTVGYGEVYPRTWIGKTVGSACAICGVLVIALPVSVVASNFSLFYTYAKARLNVPPKKRRVALSHALKSMHNTRTHEDEQQSLKFTSLCSERQTEKSLQASDISFTCSVTPRGSLKKSSFWSLRSFSKVLRPSKPSYASRSRSLNSILSEIKQNNKDMSLEGITLRLDPPTRAPSAIEISPKEGSLPTGDSSLLHVPGGKSYQNIKGSLKEPYGTPLLNKSLYPLHLRRGAVSPASFSLKSNSTASSLNALPRGYNELCNALSGKGPIILLSDQASVQSFCSLQSLNPLMTCSCSSLRTTGTDGDGPSGNGDKLDSPTTKMEVTQTTLSVPKERHGMGKGGKESVTGTMKGNACNPSLRNENNLDEAGEVEEQKEETVASMEKNREDMNTSDNSNNGLTIREAADSRREGHSLAENETDLITSPENYLTKTRANQFNLNASTANSAESSPDIEHPARGDESSSHTTLLNSESTSFERNKSHASTEDNSMAKTPVRPAPLVRKPSLCASPSTKCELGKGMLSVNTKHPDDSGNTPRSRTESLDMVKNSNSTSGGNSAFTLCRKGSISSLPGRRSGHFSTTFMRGTPGEREPLLNGHVTGACLPDIRTVTELKRLGRNGSHCVEPSSTHSATIENHNKHQFTDGMLRGQRNHESSDNLQNISVSHDFSFLKGKGLDQNSVKDRSNKDRTTRV